MAIHHGLFLIDRRCESTLLFLPLSKEWKTSDYVFIRGRIRIPMKAVALAAGKGTRLRPLTDEKPKGMVEVDGKPILTRCFE